MTIGLDKQPKDKMIDNNTEVKYNSRGYFTVHMTGEDSAAAMRFIQQYVRNMENQYKVVISSSSFNYYCEEEKVKEQVRDKNKSTTDKAKS